jgi:hypothetical protein
MSDSFRQLFQKNFYNFIKNFIKNFYNFIKNFIKNFYNFIKNFINSCYPFTKNESISRNSCISYNLFCFNNRILPGNVLFFDTHFS